MNLAIWLDNYVHVSDFGPDDAVHLGFLEILLAVIDAEPRSLRFVIGPDGRPLCSTSL